MSGNPGNWRKIDLAGNTMCGDGTPYSFWVREGTENKLLIYFQGGGACWDADSCAIYPSKHFNIIEKSELAKKHGIFRFSRTDNPFLHYHFAFIPYCTADFHWGNNDPGYNGQGGNPIFHRGFVNAEAALDQVFVEFSNNFDIIFVTGSSAGGLGSILHAPYIIDRHKGLSVSHLSDSAAGVVHPSVWPPIFQNYRVIQNLPDWLKNSFTSTFSITNLYIAIANRYPDNIFSQFNYAQDKTQVLHFRNSDSGSGSVQDFTEHLEASIASIHTHASNFRSFTVRGTNHCILSSPEFYQLQVGTIALKDWVYQLAEMPQMTPNIHG